MSQASPVTLASPVWRWHGVTPAHDGLVGVSFLDEAGAIRWIRLPLAAARQLQGALGEARQHRPDRSSEPTQPDEVVSLSAPVPIGRAFTESRIAVDDGYIWPFERARMIAPGAIRERMVEDIVTLVHADGDHAIVSLEDLRRQGWPQTHLDAHAAVAFAHYRARHSRPHKAHGSQDSLGRIAAETAALALFTGPLLLWAGIATGVL